MPIVRWPHARRRALRERGAPKLPAGAHRDRDPDRHLMMRATCQLLTIAISARWSRAGYDNACSQASTTSHNGPDRRTFLEPPQANDAHLVTAQTGSALSKRLIPSVF